MNCLMCDKEFTKKVDKQVFCCSKCSYYFYRNNTNRPTKTIQHTISCLACKKEIVTDNTIRKYCNKKCKNDYKNRLRDEEKFKKKELIKCKICDNLFLDRTGKRKFCSERCKFLDWRLYSDGIEWTKRYNRSEKMKEIRHRYMTTNVQAMMKKKLCDIVHKSIINKYRGSMVAMDLLDASIDEARGHLESLFKPGMTWANHKTDGWHIDHIVPCSSFDLTDPIQQKKCFHYTNLQPLWHYENMDKHTKIATEEVLQEMITWQ